VEVPATYAQDGHSAQCSVETDNVEGPVFVVLNDSGDALRSKVSRHESADALEESAHAPATLLSVMSSLGWLDRYLFVWILITMVIGVVVGNYVPGIQQAFNTVKIDSVTLPIAIGLWWMIYPVLCKVHYELLGRQLLQPDMRSQLLVSVILNWIIGPALMTGLAWATLPDLPAFRNGVILIGCARCIAMVLIWNQLAAGDTDFCAVLVAVNSVLQIVLYAPVALLYIDVISGGTVSISFASVAKSVAFFLGIPLAAAFTTWLVLRKLKGASWYNDKFLPWFGPTALIGLLFTIFVMFALQGKQIIHNLGEVCRVAVPLLIYFAISFVSTLALCVYLKFPYEKSVTQTFTASSNNFELAIAVAVAVFGIDSKEALAATVGPLIEVPVLLVLVYLAIWLKNRLW